MTFTGLAGLKRRAATGDYHVHGDPTQADCIIGFSFGLRDGSPPLPGISNEDIARYIITHFATLPKIVQWEIDDALDDSMGDIYRIEHHREAGKYLDTREVADQAKRIMAQQRWEKALVITHPYHIPRADEVCRKLGIFTITPPGLEIIHFDPESSQDWTRSATAWASREAGAIDHYAQLGWL